jgi:polysaccharide biosynthesis protein PslG
MVDRLQLVQKRRNRIVRTASLLVFLLIGSSIIAFLQTDTFKPILSLAPKPAVIPNSYFAMTVHNYQSPISWSLIPFSSIRTWDTDANWADINKARNTFVWSKLDEMMNLAQRRGVDLIFTLGRTPRWASASPNAQSPYGEGQCAPPADMQYWDEFLRAAAIHANGRIKFWETWNEPQSPDSIFYCGNVSAMVELQRRAYEIIKAIDPSAMVLTPSAVGSHGPSWMSRFLAAGAGKYADIMAFHGYLAPGEKAESIISTILNFKAVFAAHGEKEKPVWDTEAGWGQNAWLSDPDLQAAFLAKFYLLHWSTGIDRLYWYAFDNDQWGTLWDPKNGLHKAGVAYREIHRWLQGGTMTSPCLPKQSLWMCNVNRENGYRAIVLWSSDTSASVSHMALPPEFRQYRDLSGNVQKIPEDGVPISGAPILAETAAGF